MESSRKVLDSVRSIELSHKVLIQLLSQPVLDGRSGLGLDLQSSSAQQIVARRSMLLLLQPVFGPHHSVGEVANTELGELQHSTHSSPARVALSAARELSVDQGEEPAWNSDS
jgi:hypothetical protein